MAIHPADKRSDNPRLQCSVCAEWKRLHGRDPVTGRMIYRFFGGCSYNHGNDHLAGKANTDGCIDVCDTCCHIHCKEIAKS
jgi:hypothetical protein